jgi:hypothetical protein
MVWDTRNGKLFPFKYAGFVILIHLLQNGAQPKVPRYRPAVKFRKISKDTLEKLQNSGDTIEIDASDVEEIDDDGNPDVADLPDSSSDLPSTEFLIDPDININSLALLDMISEKDIFTKPTTNTVEAGEPTASSQARSMTVDEAFAMWA